MENPNLSTAVNLLCDIATQHFQATQDLTLALAAMRIVLQEQGNPAFPKAYQEKIQALKGGDVGQQIARGKAEFDRRMLQVKKHLK
jgi:hypothetical protein